MANKPSRKSAQPYRSKSRKPRQKKWPYVALVVSGTVFLIGFALQSILKVEQVDWPPINPPRQTTQRPPFQNPTQIPKTNNPSTAQYDKTPVHVAPLNVQARPFDPNKITLMSFNAEFMWDGYQPEEGRIEFDWKNSLSAAEKHMRGVAEVIAKGQADVVNLVEVENLTSLSVLNDKFLSPFGYRPYLETGIDTYTAQDVGLLSRIEPQSFKYDSRKGKSGYTNKSVSKNYVAVVKLGPYDVALISAHFLSRPDDKSRVSPRQAQANAIASMAIEQQRLGRAIVIWGDLNDFDGNSDAADIQDNQPITSVLADLREMDPKNAKDDLVNVIRWVPKDQRYTAFWDRNSDGQINSPGEYSAIDHVLISPQLAKHVESVQIIHEHDPRLVSDHFPIVVRLDFSRTVQAEFTSHPQTPKQTATVAAN